MKYCLTILLLLGFLCSSAAQEHAFISNRGQNQLLQIYQSPEADFLSLITESDMSSPEEEYLRLYNLFIAFQANERELYAQSFHKGLKQFETAFEPTPQVKLMQAALLIQQSLLYWNKEESSSGARSFYKAHRLFRKLNKDDYPQEYLKLEALFHIFLSQIPEQFQFWASLFGLEGNLETGFRLLNAHNQNCREKTGLYCEALVLKAYCLLKFGSPDNQLINELILQAKEQQSPLLSFIVSSLSIKNRLGDEGLAFINSIDKTSFESFPLLTYMQGRLLLNQLDSNSFTTLQQFTTSYQGHSFKTDALLRQAWWWHLQNKKALRDTLMNRVSSQTKLPTSNDKQAKKEISSLSDKPINLLKSRLLYDGGNYKTAYQVLNSTNPLTLDTYNLPEYHYRLGRICTELNNTNEALAHFNNTIELSADDTRYFGPYAAIEAAKIKFKQQDTIQAHKYLQQAQQLNNGEYKQDIARTIAAFINE